MRLTSKKITALVEDGFDIREFRAPVLDVPDRCCERVTVFDGRRQAV
jgi:hypothetical protein